MSVRTTRAAATVAALSLTVPLGLAGTALAGGEKSRGDERPQTAPGQSKPAQGPARPAHPQGEARGHQKQSAKAPKAKTRKAPKATKPAKAPKAEKPAPAAAKAGKTTICHATGSATNPYVQITISDNALKAHARHQDGRDIIPAPAGGCPKPEPAAAKHGTAAKPVHGKDAKGREKVTICHATGSDTNPYVKITIAAPAVEAHRRHQDGRDIIPAPEGDCPAAAVAPASTAKALSLGAPEPQVLGATAGREPGPATARGGVLGSFATGTSPQGDVLGETAGTTRRESGDTAAATGRLPFTGADVLILVALGLGALLGGVALHRSLSRTAA